MCTSDISCSGFNFNKLTAECQLSQLSNPKSSLCSSCFFHSKRCTSAPDSKTLPVSSTTISTTPVKSTSNLFTKPTISMTKFFTTESSSAVSNVKPRLVTSAISKSINTNTADVKLFPYITNSRSTFERHSSNTNDNKTEIVKFQITTASSVKPSTTDIGTSKSLDKSTDISNVRLTSNITPQPTTDVRNTTPIALTFTSSNTYSHPNAIKVYTQTSQSPNNTRIVQSSQFSDRIFQNTTTSNLLQTFTTAFSPLNFTNAVSTADVQMTSVNNQINNSTPRILCSCSCRETESNLDQLILQRKKELKVEVKTLSITKRKYISVSDPRTSSKAVGYLGILILCLFGALIVATDLINLIPKAAKILPTNTSS
ncbi:uncharacterized protein LOC128186471 [Crassostrea angulata]|uniref:uncharacterized protein LOC128186471 n=1 Tax=Magallana angulata TaxID=2784310 RepID=UPI0022B13E34|nr:uncharacterized protein LOC128186471 [Crassostrea angulata]